MKWFAFSIASYFVPLVLFIGSSTPQAASKGKQSTVAKVDWSVFLPAGEGRAEVIVSCSGCHGLSQVLTQNKSKAGWNTSVRNMVTINQAPVPQEEIPIIVEYLAKEFGGNNPIQQLPINLNKSSSKVLARLPGISTDLASAIVEYRKNTGPFATVDSLLNVSGMNASKLRRIKPYITTR